MRTGSFDLLQHSRRQVEFDFLGGQFFFGFGIAALADFRGRACGLGAGGVFVDVDAVALEGGEQVVDLLRRVHLGREHVVYLVVEQVAAFLAHVDELADLVIRFLQSPATKVSPLVKPLPELAEPAPRR